MFRILTSLAWVLLACCASRVDAQHHHGHRNQGHPVFPLIIGIPQPMGSNFPPPSVSVLPVVHKTADIVTDPAKHPAKPSTPASKLKSLEYQSRGDEKLRKQLWAQAYINYRNAADVAGDRGEAHFRLGYVYTAMQYYPSAVREFRRGLFLSPDLPASGIRLGMLFGPESEVVRTSILLKVIDWVREDLNDPDRLFLLGLLLHFEDDPRRVKVLQTANKLAGSRHDHIRAILAQPDVPPLPGAKKLPIELPELPEIPNPLPTPPAAGLGFNPLPQGFPHAGQQQVGLPHPPPPIGLPPLLDKPTPLPPPPIGKP